mgnify:CR=1 FL=1
MNRQNDILDELNFSKYDKSYLQQALFPETLGRDYKKLKVPLGIDKRTKKIVYLDYNTANRCLIIGQTGSGKTLLMRSIFIDRFFLTKGISIVLTDLKPEFFCSSSPAQKKFEKNYLQYEHAKGLDVVVYYPKCFEKLIKHYDNYLSIIKKWGIIPKPIAISFENLGLNEFLTLSNRTFTESQHQFLTTIFLKKQNNEIKNLDELSQQIKTNTKDFDISTTRAIDITLKLLIGLELINDKYDFNLLDDIKNKKLIILALAGWDDIRNIIYYPASFVSLFVRKILEYKKRGLIYKEKINLIVDEAPQFVNKESNLSSKIEIVDCIKIGREFGISMTFGSQDLRNLDNPVFEQSTFILLSHDSSLELTEEIFKNIGLLAHVDSYEYKTRLRALMNRLEIYKDGSRDWLFINKERKSNKIVKTLPSLSWHREELKL